MTCSIKSHTMLSVACVQVFCNLPPWNHFFFQPLILGHQRLIGGHYVVNGDRHDGLHVTVVVSQFA